MDAHELPVTTAEQAVRLVRALGQHRYVASRLHLVHAFAFEAVEHVAELREPASWARAILSNPDVDPGSKDERLFRRSSEAEIAALLDAFWSGDAAAVHARLRRQLEAVEVRVPDQQPFDEAHEEDTFPVLIDAGWELLPLAALDPERHKGAMLAFGEPILFEAAKFDEDTLREPPVYLQELSVFGPVELLAGVDSTGTLRAPLVLWTNGPEPYHDYVLRGVLRAAKLT